MKTFGQLKKGDSIYSIDVISGVKSYIMLEDVPTKGQYKGYVHFYNPDSTEGSAFYVDRYEINRGQRNFRSKIFVSDIEHVKAIVDLAVENLKNSLKNLEK